MADIPTGFVNFLFTDIEGSTRLAQENPDKLSSALEIHNRILKAAIESNNGFVFEIVGDAFCCSFKNAEDAVKASVEAQEKLTTENWDDIVIKVRIGINSGEAQWTGKKYSGYLTLARTQRIMSAAHGGQILISDNSKDKISQNFTDKISFRDLGERRLKDLIKPLKLFQITSQEIQKDFPPIKTLDLRQNNLPVQLTSFIGREKEMTEIRKHLKSTHLLTLTGFGGTGKTRLSLQTGADMIDDFADGVFFIELATLTESSYVALEIASALSLKETGTATLKEELINFLREKEMLLILDNCEHLIDECAAIVSQILRSCKKVKVICNSREPLHIEGEVIYQVSSLVVPELKNDVDVNTLITFEAINLFSDRAKSAKPDFAITESNGMSVYEICRRLDGIPLAIELAAARVRTLSVETILEKINDRFRLLSGSKRNTLPMHQELSAMIDWSYDLLPEKEKTLFQCLSVFAGVFTLDAAEKICSNEILDEPDIVNLLSNLSDKSLIKTIDSNDTERFGMLETILLYSKHKFDNNSLKSIILENHAGYFLEFMKNSEQKLKSGSQKESMITIEADIDNIREAIKWNSKTNPELALQIAVHMCLYWSIKGAFSEGLEILNSCIEKAGNMRDLYYGRALLWKAFFFLHKGRYHDGREPLNLSIEIFRKAGDENETANALSYLGVIEVYEGNLTEAKKIQEECLRLRNKTGDARGTAACLNSLGMISYKMSDYESAAKHLEDGLKLYRDINDSRGIAASLGNLGKISSEQKDYSLSKNYYEESLRIASEIGDNYVIAHCLEGIANALTHSDEYESACKLLSSADNIFKKLSVKLSPEEVKQFERNLQKLKEKLGDTFEKVWEEGKEFNYNP